jgi:MoxR-like ATPase
MSISETVTSNGQAEHVPDGHADHTADASPAGDTAARLRDIVAELSTMFFERGPVVRAIVVAMLAGEHSLLLGPPGTAKSQLASELTGRITGARFWKIQLSSFVDPKRIFGPIDLIELMKGNHTQIFERRATWAEIAFIDEIFKCSDAALNEMLGFLNEREYCPESGGEPISCPLISAVTASNELPTGGATIAFYDRLLVRLQVEYIKDPVNFGLFLRSRVARAAPGLRTTITLAELRGAIDNGVPTVAIPEDVFDIVGELRAVLEQKDIVVSDRRLGQSMRLLQASAWLDGRDTVGESDLDMLTHVLWDRPEERPIIERELVQLVDPSAPEVLEQLDAIDELEAAFDEMRGQSRAARHDWILTEANVKLRLAGQRLDELRREAVDAGHTTALIDHTIRRGVEVFERLAREGLGVDPSTIRP